MSFLHVNFTEADTQIAHFARSIALPIRVFIIRMIAENGNSISKQTFYNSAFDARAINKHIMELKSLGIIKVKTVKAQVTYGIDQHLFDQMSAQFGILFDQPAKGAATAEEDVHPLSTEEQAGSFGAFIKQHRLELHLSQESLSAKLGIDRALLSRIECGRRPFLADKLNSLAKALYINADALKAAYLAYGGVC